MSKYRQLAFEIVDRHYCKGSMIDAVSATEQALIQVERETYRQAADIVSKQSYRISKVGTDVMTVISKLEALAEGKLEMLKAGEMSDKANQ